MIWQNLHEPQLISQHIQINFHKDIKCRVRVFVKWQIKLYWRHLIWKADACNLRDRLNPARYVYEEKGSCAVCRVVPRVGRNGCPHRLITAFKN